MKDKEIKLALICTLGGHFEQMTNLSDFYNKFDHFWVTNKSDQTVNTLINENKYYVKAAHFKKPWTYLFHIPTFVRLFAKEKPTHILSTGSGRTTFIPFILAILKGIKFIHIDTFSRVHGYSKFGSFLLKFGHQVCTQWEDHNNKKTLYIGPIFKKVPPFTKGPDSNYIFITVGSRKESFKRLLQAIEDLNKEGTIKEKVIVQGGHTKYTSDHMEIFDFCAPKKIEELVKNANYVITQESAGIGSICLKYQTKFIVMPRDYKYKELPTKSDMKEDLHLKLEELGYTKVVTDVAEMRNVIMHLDTIKTGFKFDNTLAITELTRIIEEVSW